MISHVLVARRKNTLALLALLVVVYAPVPDATSIIRIKLRCRGSEDLTRFQEFQQSSRLIKCYLLRSSYRTATRHPLCLVREMRVGRVMSLPPRRDHVVKSVLEAEQQQQADHQTVNVQNALAM